MTRIMRYAAREFFEGAKVLKRERHTELRSERQLQEEKLQDVNTAVREIFEIRNLHYILLMLVVLVQNLMLLRFSWWAV